MYLKTFKLFDAYSFHFKATLLCYQTTYTTKPEMYKLISSKIKFPKVNRTFKSKKCPIYYCFYFLPSNDQNTFEVFFHIKRTKTLTYYTNSVDKVERQQLGRKSRLGRRTIEVLAGGRNGSG